jgi:opacity protein-like surface antigen
MLRKCIRLLSLVLFFSIGSKAFGQVTPHAQRGGIPITAGIGYSNFQTDWNGKLGGTTVWANWGFDLLRPPYDGLGIEIEGRDLNYNHTGSGPLDPKLREETVTGGPIYNLRHYHGFQPYAKFLIGLGGIYFSPFEANFPNYTHDTRTIYAPGVGLNYRFHGAFSIRGDYEYQMWPSFIHNHALTPYGITIGVLYDFRTRSGR